jgi:hypothetical protein
LFAAEFCFEARCTSIVQLRVAVTPAIIRGNIMSPEENVLRRVDALIEKADRVLATHHPNPPGVVGLPSLDSEAFAEWKAQSLTCLISLLGTKQTYVETFREEIKRGFKGTVESGKGILKAVRQDIAGGYLTKVETLVSADIFNDFLEMAEELLNQGFKGPSASLTGAVLEDGLRRICAQRPFKLGQAEDLTSLSKNLADANVYNRLTQNKIQSWNDLRNRAVHGKITEYRSDDVKEMIKGVREFLEQYL